MENKRLTLSSPTEKYNVTPGAGVIGGVSPELIIYIYLIYFMYICIIYINKIASGRDLGWGFRPVSSQVSLVKDDPV